MPLDTLRYGMGERMDYYILLKVKTILNRQTITFGWSQTTMKQKIILMIITRA